VVTAANLLASERFWPYQIALTRSWQPVGRAQPLRSGSTGVLIRVERSGLARIDFGRDGLYEIPVAETDLVERANRVRRGELEKTAPNFVLAIGPRLVSTKGESLVPFPYEEAARQELFLSVFADPGAQGFRDLAAVLAPLDERQGVLTILFPQGEHPDAKVHEQLRSLRWMVPFVYDHLAEPYTRSLLTEETQLPAVMLQTKEGRVRFESECREDVLPELSRALERASGGSLAEDRRE
jgi:hypothetical protein